VPGAFLPPPARAERSLLSATPGSPDGPLCGRSPPAGPGAAGRPAGGVSPRSRAAARSQPHGLRRARPAGAFLPDGGHLQAAAGSAQIAAMAGVWNEDLISVEQARTLDGLFRVRVQRSAEREAYRHYDRASGEWRSLTWGEMARLAGRWQAALGRDAAACGGAGRPGRGGSGRRAGAFRLGVAARGRGAAPPRGRSPRPRLHRVHLRHHRPPQGRDAEPPQHAGGGARRAHAGGLLPGGSVPFLPAAVAHPGAHRGLLPAH